MRTINQKNYLLSILLSILILLQGCRVYQREAVDIERAVESQKRVKIKTTKNKILKYTSIIYENGNFYGIRSNKNSSKYQKILLNQNEIKTTRLHNKPLSIILGILLPVTIFVGTILLTFSASSGPFIGTINFSY